MDFGHFVLLVIAICGWTWGWVEHRGRKGVQSDLNDAVDTVRRRINPDYKAGDID